MPTPIQERIENSVTNYLRYHDSYARQDHYHRTSEAGLNLHLRNLDEIAGNPHEDGINPFAMFRAGFILASVLYNIKAEAEAEKIESERVVIEIKEKDLKIRKAA